MANRVYCTYFDHNYLPRGLALYHSLQRHAPGAQLWVLCLSEACHQALTALDLPNLVPVRLADFEAANPDVAATRPTRSMIEYYFTCSPAWMLFVLNSKPDAEWVTYLDSDLFFFASPDPIYDEMKDAAFGIIPHRFATRAGRPAPVRTLQCRLGQRSQARRRHRGACAGGASAASNGAMTASRATASPTSAISTGCRKCLAASMSYRISGPISRPGILPIAVCSGTTARSRSSDDIKLLFFHFYGVKRSGGVLLQQPPAVSRAIFQPDEAQTYEPYMAALAEAERLVAPLSERAADRDDPKAGCRQAPATACPMRCGRRE